MKRKIEWAINRAVLAALLWMWLEEGNTYAQNIIYFLTPLFVITGIAMTLNDVKKDYREKGYPVNNGLFQLVSYAMVFWVAAYGHWWVAGSMFFSAMMTIGAYDSKPKEEK